MIETATYSVPSFGSKFHFHIADLFTHRPIPEGEEECADCGHGLTSEHARDGRCLVRVCGHKPFAERGR